MKGIKPFAWMGVLLLLVCSCAGNAERVERDVPYVPTPEPVVAEMLRLADVKKSDVLYDLGSGDGRIVITAAREHGTRGVGVDIDPQRVRESRTNARAAGVEDKVKFHEQDLFKTDFREATVVTMYLLPSVNIKLRPRLLEELRPGTRVVSHAFDMGDWKPEQTSRVSGTMVYLWIIPAQAGGAWDATFKGPDGERAGTLQIQQRFQMVTGTATIDGREMPLRDGRLTGGQLVFTLDDPRGGAVRYECRVDGDRLQGSAKGAEITLSARRTQEQPRQAE